MLLLAAAVPRRTMNRTPLNPERSTTVESIVVVPAIVGASIAIARSSEIVCPNAMIYTSHAYPRFCSWRLLRLMHTSLDRSSAGVEEVAVIPVSYTHLRSHE